jgi:hypothetical protein
MTHRPAGGHGSRAARWARLAAAAASLRGLAAGVAVWLAAAPRALADSPVPTQAAIGDPRAGQTATLAGNPGLAIAIVVLVAVVAVVATLAWIRATGGPGSHSRGR